MNIHRDSTAQVSSQRQWTAAVCRHSEPVPTASCEDTRVSPQPAVVSLSAKRRCWYQLPGLPRGGVNTGKAPLRVPGALAYSVWSAALVGAWLLSLCGAWENTLLPLMPVYSSSFSSLKLHGDRVWPCEVFLSELVPPARKDGLGSQKTEDHPVLRLICPTGAIHIRSLMQIPHPFST